MATSASWSIAAPTVGCLTTMARPLALNLRGHWTNLRHEPLRVGRRRDSSCETAGQNRHIFNSMHLILMCITRLIRGAILPHIW